MAAASNRVISGAQADNAFNVNYHYDPWGNMTESGTSSFQPLFDGRNRMVPSGGCTPNLPPFCYDASGDLLMDNHNLAYTYDSEARIKTVAAPGVAATYTYGPDGSRVRKDANGTATEYIYFGGNVIAEKTVTSGAWTDYIFGYGGKRIAKDTSTNGSGAQYYQDDQLGTTRIMTDAAGTKILDCTFNAFGEQISCSPDNTSNHYRYTGKERDTESGLDDFGARYYSSTMGRWTTPDWSERPTAIPYAVFGDPQSLNLYLYVRNDPVSNADADGHIDDNADPDHPVTPSQGQGQAWSLSWQVNASASFLGEELKGVGDATITPVVNAVEHPIATVEGLANAVAHPVETAKGAVNAAVDTVKAAANGNPRTIGQVVATAATVAYAASNVKPMGYKNSGGGGLNILNTPTKGSRLALDVHSIPEAGGAVRPHVDITIKRQGVPFGPKVSGPGSNLINIKHWPWN